MLSCGIVYVLLCLAVLVELRLVTDGETDGRTITGPWLVPRMHSIAPQQRVGTGSGWSTEVAIGIRKESSGSSKDMCNVSSTRRIGGKKCTGTKDMITQ